MPRERVKKERDKRDGDALKERMAVAKLDKKKEKDNLKKHNKKLQENQAIVTAFTPEDLRDPDKKRRHDDAKAEIEKVEKSIIECSAGLKQLSDEVENLEDEMEGVEETGETLAGPSSQSTSQETAEGSSSQSTSQETPEGQEPAEGSSSESRLQGSSGEGTADQPILVPEEDLIILKPNNYKPTSGLPDSEAEKYREVVAVKNGQGGGRIGIVKYGPRNAPVYRREDITGDDFPGVEDISNPLDRPGERFKYESDSKRKVWFLNHNQLAHVQGVAFPESSTLKDLDPKRQLPRGREVRFPLDILIVWNTPIDEAGNKKSWETFSTFRRIWGRQRESPESAIFDAATFAQRRFSEWKRHERRSLSRSPTPNPIFNQGKGKKTVRFERHVGRQSDTDSESEGDESDTQTSESDDEEETPRAKKKKKKKRETRGGRRSKRSKNEIVSDESESDDSEDDERRPKGRKREKARKSKGKSRRSRHETDSDESDGDSEEDNMRSRKNRRSKGKGKSRKSKYDTDSEESEGDSSDEDDDNVDPKKFKKAWCYSKGKDIRKLSKKDEQRIKRDLKKLRG